MNAELHLWQTEAHAAVVGGDAVAAGERKLQAAAEGETVDGRGGGAGQRFEAVHHLLPRADQLVGLLRCAQADELLDVGTGDEATRLRGAHHDRARVRALDVPEQLIELLQHFG
jgi:hypothetical protein